MFPIQSRLLIEADSWKWHYRFFPVLSFKQRLQILFGLPVLLGGDIELTSRGFPIPDGETLLLQLDIFINEPEKGGARGS